jgi:hypothetical protein
MFSFSAVEVLEGTRWFRVRSICKCQFPIIFDIKEWRALVSTPGEGGNIRVGLFSGTGSSALAI